MPDKITYYKGLVALFAENENIEQGIKMTAYVRDKFLYFGIKAPLRKELTKRYINENGMLPYTEMEWLVKQLYEQSKRELHYVAMELLFKYKRDWTKEDIALLEYLVVENSWWDTVDYVVATLIGAYFKKFPELIEPITTMWSQSENMWLIRSCIIFQLKYKEETDRHLLEKFILQNSHSKEFFIQKAIGWALRQYSRFNPDWVMQFVDKNELKPLSRKEAIRLMI